MKLPFFSKHSNNSDYYLGLFLQEDKIVGFLFEIGLTGLSITAQDEYILSNGWENIVEDTDSLLFRLETETQKKFSKVIFFVYSYFVDDQTKEIKKEYKDVIKNIIKQLDLKPLGFIECYEAVAAYLEKKEEVPLNAIVIESDKNNKGIFVFKNGKQLISHIIGKSDDIVLAITDIFNAHKSEFLFPSRIVLYPAEETKQDTLQIMHHKWKEEIFTQIPRIQVIKREELYEGLSQVFADQLQSQKEPEKEIEQTAMAEERFADKELDDIDEDIMGTYPPEEKVSQPPPVFPTQTPPPEEVLGFVIGQDIADLPSQNQPQPTVAKKPVFSFSAAPFMGFLSRFTSLISGRKILNFKSVWFVGLVAVLLIIFISEYFLHKVSITVLFPSKTIAKDIEFSSDAFEIKVGTESAEVSEKKVTTGKKNVGEKAKGEVTLYNFDEKDKSIAKGTTITSEGHVFSLDQDVKVTAASDSVVNGVPSKQPGKVKVNVTATTIGPDNNLDKGKKFTIDSLSQAFYFAINDNAFSGGSQKEVRTVSKKDMDDLKAKVLDEGKNQTVENMKKNVTGDQQILDKLTKQDIDKLTYSKDLGEEADEVSLKAEVKTTYFSYSTSDLATNLKQELDKEVPSGYSLPADKVHYTVDDATLQGSTVDLSLKVEGKAIKEVDSAKVVSLVVGKNKKKLDDILKNQLNASGYELQDKTPAFFPLKSWMPFMKKNIEVKISSL